MTGNGGAPEGMWSSPQDLVGTILADRYQVQKVIGDGGMGSVFLAEHVTLRKRVALKVLHPELCRDQTHVDRFLQEARSASMISHENIVDIVDFGTVPGGSVFFVMEYLEGHDLSGALRQGGRMPWPRVQNFMLQIVRALKAAHQKGIIHRDLKPANCFVVTKPDGREVIKLLDFGIAKDTNAENDKGLTRTGAVFGTAKYMAPEQACGEVADQRTDIYAAAVLMYELLTGVVPFDGDNFMRVLSRHLTEPLTLPSTMAPDAGIPPMVESIVVKALSKKRQDRYQSMAEYEEALLALGPDGTLRGGMGGMAYSAPMTSPPSGPGATLPLDDSPGHTQWLGPSVQASQGPVSQPPEGRGGTLLLDADSRPPEFMNQPGVQGPTGWSAASGGTMMMDGMGQDVLPGPGGAAITRNPPMMGAGAGRLGTNPPPLETRPPMGSDPMYEGYEEESSRKGLLILALGGAVAAIGLGGLVAWLFLDEPVPETSSSETPAVVAKKDPDTKVLDTKVPDTKVPTDTKIPPDPVPDTKVPPDPVPESGDDDGELTLEDDDGEAPVDTAGQTDPVPDPNPETKTNRPRPKPNPPKVKDVRDSKDLGKGFAKAAAAAKACGGKNGALPGQKLLVEATINSSGSVVSANVSGPSRNTPLGKCVAGAVKSSARFVASKQPLQIEKHEYKM